MVFRSWTFEAFARRSSPQGSPKQTDSPGHAQQRLQLRGAARRERERQVQALRQKRADVMRDVLAAKGAPHPQKHRQSLRSSPGTVPRTEILVSIDCIRILKRCLVFHGREIGEIGFVFESAEKMDGTPLEIQERLPSLWLNQVMLVPSGSRAVSTGGCPLH